jgi:hypothetical protein
VFSRKWSKVSIEMIKVEGVRDVLDSTGLGQITVADLCKAAYEASGSI